MSTTIRRHPDDATLLSYAAGALAEPLAAAVAAHVSVCSHCRREVGDMELLGATLLLAAAPARGLHAAPFVTERKAVVGAPRGNGTAKRRGGSSVDKLPAPIAETYGLTFESIPWKRLAPGVWHHRLPLSADSRGDLRLLKIGPGRRMPEHGHGGAELTLVIAGAYSDETGEYRPGDMQDVDDGVEHRPIADAEVGCVCIVASERPARFKGLIGRLMQPWTGM